MNMRHPIFVSWFLACLTVLRPLFASDAELLNIFAGPARAAAVTRYLEPLPEGVGTGTTRRSLSSVQAFGASFSGEAFFESSNLKTTQFWCDDQKMTPAFASNLFGQLSSALRERLGQGKSVQDVPNYGDASDVKTQIMLWTEGDDVILLSMDTYPKRAGVTVIRQSRATWQAGMGADEGMYWHKTLEKGGESTVPITPDAPKSAVTSPSPSTDPYLPDVTTPTHPKLSESNSSSPSENRAFSTPWSLMVVIVVAAAGLFWLAIKKRK